MNLNATFFFQILVFFILCWITTRFVWPPLMKAIQERQKKIEDGLAAAEKGKRELTEVYNRIYSLETASKIAMQEKIAETEKKALLILEKAKEEAKLYHSHTLDFTKNEIQRTVKRARESLQHDLSDLIVKGAEQILKREIDAKKHSEILSKLKEQL